MSPPSHREAVDAAKRAWDASAPIHRESRSFRELLEGVRDPGFSCLDTVLHAELVRIGVEDATIAQLCCNNGRELLSVGNMGARSVVGFDQSAVFLDQARELARAAGRPAETCRFVEADIHAMPTDDDGTCDLVLVTIGVFGWLPEPTPLFQAAAQLLSPGGALVVYEQHPVMNMMDPYEGSDPHRLAFSYFQAEPFREQGPILYTADAPSNEGPVHYWFVHTMGDIVTACLETGFTLERFREYPHNISSDAFDVYDGQEAQLPQSYLLSARMPPA